MSTIDNINGIYARDTELRNGINTLRNTVVSKTIKPLTVTKNGTYTAIPSSGTYGYSPVTVNVPNSDIDTTFLPNSTASKILASARAPQNINLVKNQLYVSLTNANTDVTAYCVIKNRSNNEGILMCVPYNNTNGNNPSFYSPSSSYAIECTIYSDNTRVDNITCDTFHVYTLAINATTKKVRYYIDGTYLMEKTFINSGGSVVTGTGDISGSSFANGNPLEEYLGVVTEFESDETIIANQLVIMQKLGLSV